jgi:hypothetical protein
MVALEYNKIGGFRIYKILQDHNETGSINMIPGQADLELKEGFEQAYFELKVLLDDIFSG